MGPRFRTRVKVKQQTHRGLRLHINQFEEMEALGIGEGRKSTGDFLGKQFSIVF